MLSIILSFHFTFGLFSSMNFYRQTVSLLGGIVNKWRKHYRFEGPPVLSTTDFVAIQNFKKKRVLLQFISRFMQCIHTSIYACFGFTFGYDTDKYHYGMCLSSKLLRRNIAWFFKTISKMYLYYWVCSKKMN